MDTQGEVTIELEHAESDVHIFTRLANWVAINGKLRDIGVIVMTACVKSLRGGCWGIGN